MTTTDRPNQSQDKSSEEKIGDKLALSVWQASKESFSDAYRELLPGATENRAVRGGENPPPAKDNSANMPDGAHVENGRLSSLTRGGVQGDSYFVDYSGDGSVKSISANVAGHSKLFEAGKDFVAGSVKTNQDGTLSFVLPDGKHSLTLNKDFSAVTKEIGDKPDGSADRIVNIKTAEGVNRTIRWEPVPGGGAGQFRVSEIEDRLSTNSGKELIETTRRIGDTNTFQLDTNYGRNKDRSEMRTNVALQTNGDLKYDTIKIARPNDLVDVDNRDSMHNVAAARKHFIDLAKGKDVFGGKDSTLEEWCRKFEHRCYQLSHQGWKAPTDEQISQTYHQMERILEGHGGMSAAQRKRLVQDALHDCADPNHYINQYQHPSCAFASASRIVIQARPDSYVRVLCEMANNGGVRSASKMSSADTMYSDQKQSGGKFKVIKFNHDQLVPHNDWPSFSNQLFQTFAIKCGYPGYQGWGDNFPGGDEHQMSRVKKFATGDGHLHLVNGWSGQTGTFDQLQKALKRDGACAYFWPGHALAIIDARVKNGRQQVLVDNWWGNNGEKKASADGWYDFNRLRGLG